MSKKLVVIDGKSVFYRGHFAMQHLSLPDGTPTGGVFGFATMALEAIKQFEPDYVVVAWDMSKTNIRSRKAMYPEYKAGRKPMPDDMRVQIPILRDLLDALGWPLYECDDYEADDILGTLAEKAYDEAEVETIIITSDLDALQLVNGHTHVAVLKTGLSNLEYFDVDHFTDKYNLTTKQFIDLKALMGDSSDNIPGVKGVGKVTANKLLQKYETLDGVYEHLDEITGATHDKLESDKEMAYLSQKLVTIMLDAPVEFEPEASDIHNLDIPKLRNKLHELKFRSLLARVDELYGSAADSPDEIAEAPELNSAEQVELDEIEGDEVVVFSDDSSLYCSDKPERYAACDQQWLKVTQPGLVGHDLKALLKSMWGEQTPLDTIAHDTKLAGFILNPLRRHQELGELVQSELGHELPDDTEQIIPLIWQLQQQQAEQLGDTGKLAAVATDIDYPSAALLARVESRGLLLDTEQLSVLAEEFSDHLIDLEQEIYGLAGEEFNIASPQQLSGVLFETLELPTAGIKKNKTAYSTAASELAKLKHPIVVLVSDYREYSKLKSTYVDTLPDHVGDDGRVHTTFSLTTAQTGRLSSHDPNLQNIPVRSQLGRRVRQAFVPAEGHVFVNLDYSQFELRLAAALAGEQDMINAFNDGADIHQATAALMYDIELEAVTKQQRYSAKAVNFGILYGQGPHGLSQGTDMTMAEAKNFIARYFEVRPAIESYIQQLRDQANEQGYVETVMGRRRPTPDVNASNFAVREAAYRAAVNMPMQGSAADITKLAMLKLERELPAEAKQVLQVHDSIMLEVPGDMAEDIAKQGQQLMQGIYELPVKLDVDYSIEECWK